MKLLLVIVVAISSSGLALEDDKVWTKDMINDMLAKVDLSDKYLTVPELIVKYGYDAEVHKTVTEDGYILTMHRISGSPASPTTEGKPVVFLMHGLLASSVDWIITGPGKAFGYLLADAGYDVWMGNARGSTYSKNHSTITNLSGKEYWKFDWHEIGIYDLPAMIDYALEVTNQEKIIYIGHSQGTTSFYVMATEKPKYNEKIKVSFSLAPIAYMSNLKSPLLKLASHFVDNFEIFSSLFGMNEFLPSSELLSAIGEVFCNDDALTQFMCTNVLFVLCGFNKAQTNATLLPVLLGHTPAGASTRQLIHYGQEIDSAKFRLWDHGIIRNKIVYGKLHPPKYDPSKITSPTHLIYSDNDWMAAVKDVKKFWSELGNPVELYRVLDGKWNHLDFIWGINAKELVYDPILATLAAKYSD